MFELCTAQWQRQEGMGRDVTRGKCACIATAANFVFCCASFADAFCALLSVFFLFFCFSAFFWYFLLSVVVFYPNETKWVEALWAGRRGLSWGVAFCDKNMSKVLENANAARSTNRGKIFRACQKVDKEKFDLTDEQQRDTLECVEQSRWRW